MNDTDKKQHPILIEYDTDSVFPLELVQELNQAYFLHNLARNPEGVLPPGKSLISILTQEKLGHNIGKNEDQKADVQEQVAKTIHAAFWDVVLIIYPSGCTHSLIYLSLPRLQKSSPLPSLLNKTYMSSAFTMIYAKLSRHSFPRNTSS